MKKKSLLILLLIISLCVVGCSCEKQLESLPKPKVTSGIRGEQFGIDKNINEETIDKYLGRSDSVYRDMRMLKDPGNYEAIGGDSYLSGFVKGFEVVPYPLLVNVSGLPEEVGDTYTGKTLFKENFLLHPVSKKEEIINVNIIIFFFIIPPHEVHQNLYHDMLLSKNHI